MVQIVVGVVYKGFRTVKYFLCGAVFFHSIEVPLILWGLAFVVEVKGSGIVPYIIAAGTDCVPVGFISAESEVVYTCAKVKLAGGVSQVFVLSDVFKIFVISPHQFPLVSPDIVFNVAAGKQVVLRTVSACEKDDTHRAALVSFQQISHAFVHYQILVACTQAFARLFE